MQNFFDALGRRAFFDGLLSESQLHLRPLILAAREGNIALTLIKQNAGPSIPLKLSKPIVTIICDDPGHALGPASFDRASITEIARRADLAIVNAWALESLLYQYALIIASGLQQNVLFIETRLPHEQAWISQIDAANPNIRFIVASPNGGRA